MLKDDANTDSRRLISCTGKRKLITKSKNIITRLFETVSKNKKNGKCPNQRAFENEFFKSSKNSNP